MRAAFVDLDRMHVEPTSQVVVDTATVTAGAVARGRSVTATSLGHVVVGLRHLLMSCNASVSQYGAPDPDPSKDALGILNAVPIHPPAGGASTFSARVRQVLLAQAAFVRDVLTQADGSVASGAAWSGAAWSPASDATPIEAQGAALRVLVEAWFLTQDTSYRDRARAERCAPARPARPSPRARRRRTARDERPGDEQPGRIESRAEPVDEDVASEPAEPAPARLGEDRPSPALRVAGEVHGEEMQEPPRADDERERRRPGRRGEGGDPARAPSAPPRPEPQRGDVEGRPREPHAQPQGHAKAEGHRPAPPRA